ncbi:hypothetical protein AAMO2058_000202000 [Amorphochlora amoebiformis]
MELILRILLSNCTEEYIAGNIKWYVFDSILLACAIAIDVALFFPGTIPLRETLITQFVVYFVRIAIRMYIGYIGLTKGARRLVGGRKRRFIGGGFDLDLTYIEPQLIAMGLPSVNYEGLYRNPLREVVRFFNTRHKTQYRIYNLCDERDYPEEGFQGAVRRFGFDDHNPPPLSLLVRLCTEASDFINEASGHVVAIHCKGGKGRTGVVTAAMLLKMHRDWYAEKALLKFAVMRTDDDVSANKRVGVDGPSQRRYVEYWEKIRNIEPKTCLEKLSLSAPKTKFERLSLFNINVSHNFLAGQALKALKSDNKFDDSSLLGWTLSVKNYWYNPKLGKEDIKTYVFEAQASRRSATDLRRDGVSFNIKSWEQKSQTLSLSGDVRFQVFPLNVREYPDAKPFCEFWVHTSFLSRSGQLTLRKADLDHVFRNSKIDKDFNIQLTYKAGQRTWDFDRSPAVSEVNHRHASHRSGHSSKVSRTTSQTSPRRPKPPQERKLFDIS